MTVVSYNRLTAKWGNSNNRMYPFLSVNWKLLSFYGSILLFTAANLFIWRDSSRLEALDKYNQELGLSSFINESLASSPLLYTLGKTAPVNLDAPNTYACANVEIKVLKATDPVKIYLPPDIEREIGRSGGAFEIAAGQPVCVFIQVSNTIERQTNRNFTAPDGSNFPVDSVEIFASSNHTSYAFSVTSYKQSADSRVYKAELVLADSGDYRLYSFLEYVSSEWNFEDPPTVPPKQTIAFYELDKVQYPVLRVLHSDSYLRKTPETPLCAAADSNGRWRHVSAVDFSLPSLSPNPRELVWSPYSCAYRQVTHSEFAQCLNDNRVSMLWYGDSNSRRALKELAGMGHFCAHASTDKERKICYCEDQNTDYEFVETYRGNGQECTHKAELVRDNDPKDWVKPRARKASDDMAKILASKNINLLGVDSNRAVPKPKITLYRMGGLTGYYCRPNPRKGNELLAELHHLKHVHEFFDNASETHLQKIGATYAAGNLEKLKNATSVKEAGGELLTGAAHDAFMWLGKNGGYANNQFSVLMLGMVNWDVAFTSVSTYVPELDAFVSQLKDAIGDRPVPIVVRTAQFSNGVHDKSNSHRRVTRLRVEYFNALTISALRKAFGDSRVFVWDVYDLSRMLNLQQGRFDFLDCVANHAESTLIMQENQLLMNMFCYNSALGEYTRRTSAINDKVNSMYEKYFN